MRCVNCQLLILRLRKHRLLDESAEVVARVQRWVSPCEITEDDYLCQTCWELINENPNEDPEHKEQPIIGHRKVCATCGKSVLRKRSKVLVKPEMSETDTQICNVMSEWLSRQLSNSDEVCLPCYLRAKRSVDSSLKSGGSVAHSTSSEGGTQPTSNQQPDQSIGHPLNEPSPQILPTRTRGGNIVNVEEDVPSKLTDRQIVDQIVFPTLRRAAGTARRCLFMGCRKTEKRCVPDAIRKYVIKVFNFYIPRTARICNYHLGANLYHELYTHENAMNTFNAENIEEIVYLLADDSKSDFRNPENIDSHLFKYWFGWTKDEFNNILMEIPQLNNNKLKIGFCAYLCKMHTRDSNERIATLFRIPRRSLENYMQQAQATLPKHLRWIYKPKKKLLPRNSVAANFGDFPEADVETEQPISSGNTSPYQQCNAQVTHAEKIQEDVTKAFIAKVFHYLEHEFEVLKKMDAEMILSNLSKLLYRTAMATGVSETTVLEILQEEARRSAGTQESGSQGELQVPVEFTGQPRKPTRKRRKVYKKQSLDESSSEASDGSIEEVASSSIAQDTTIEPDGELMVMKAEPFEYYNEEPAINIQPVNPSAVNKEQTQVDPISLDVKEESADDDELNDCIETLARQSASSRRTYGKRDVISTHGQVQMDPVSSDVKMEQPDGQTRRQEDYCTPGTSRSHRPVIELDGRCLLRVGAVKEESENEEGFS